MGNFVRRSVEDTPPYVPGKRPDQIQTDPSVSKIIKMSSNECAFGISPHAAEAVRNTAQDLYLYPASGDEELRRRLSPLLGVAPEELIMGNGSDAVIYNLGMTVIDPGDEVIIPEVTFLIYRTIAAIMGARIVSVPMDALRIDLDALLAAITEKTKAVFLCNPNNPTGDTLDPEAVRRFLRLLPSHVLAVLDEAYIEFVDPACDPRSVDLFLGSSKREGMKNLFILRTLSKSYGVAGLRLGYGIGDKELISHMNRVKQPFEVSLPAQKAGLAALEDVQFFRHVIESTRKEADFFRSELVRLGLDFVDSQANFFLIDTGTDAKKVFEQLQRKGVIVRPGHIFGLPRHIRVSIGTRDQNSIFFTALEAVLADLPQGDRE